MTSEEIQREIIDAIKIIAEAEVRRAIANLENSILDLPRLATQYKSK